MLFKLHNKYNIRSSHVTGVEAVTSIAAVMPQKTVGKSFCAFQRALFIYRSPTTRFKDSIYQPFLSRMESNHELDDALHAKQIIFIKTCNQKCGKGININICVYLSVMIYFWEHGEKSFFYIFFVLHN